MPKKGEEIVGGMQAIYNPILEVKDHIDIGMDWDIPEGEGGVKRPCSVPLTRWYPNPHLLAYSLP